LAADIPEALEGGDLAEGRIHQDEGRRLDDRILVHLRHLLGGDDIQLRRVRDLLPGIVEVAEAYEGERKGQWQNDEERDRREQQ
jgi:hypothetical protein